MEKEATAIHKQKADFREQACSFFDRESEEEEFESVQWTLTKSPITSGRVIVLDVESTGFGRSDCLVEIGAVELIDGVRTGCIFQSYIRPDCRVHPMAYNAHRLSNKALEDAPPAKYVLASFMNWIGGSPLVGHNIRFDARMLAQELERLKFTDVSNTVFCTLQYFRHLYPGKPYSLDSISSYLGISQIFRRKTHGALLDAEITARVYQLLTKGKTAAAT